MNAHNVKIVSANGVDAARSGEQPGGEGEDRGRGGSRRPVRATSATVFEVTAVCQAARPARNQTKGRVMPQAVVCIVQSEQIAQNIVDDPAPTDSPGNDISVLFPDQTGTRDFCAREGHQGSEGVTTGATTGGIPGGAAGWLVGIGALAIPAWARSSRPVRSWRCSAAPRSARRRAVSTGALVGRHS